MKAWEVRNNVLGLHEVAPAPPGADETLVRVSHIGICGSDRPKLLHPASFALPKLWRPGHEIVGTDPTGRTVAVDPLVSCNVCPNCATGNTHLCGALRRIGWDLPGGCAEQMVVREGNVHPVPDGVDPLHATLTDPAAVAIHGLRCHPVGEPGRLAVIGAGTVGLLTALYAHEQGWDVTVVYRDGRAPHETVTTAVPAAFRSPATLHPERTFALVVDAATGTDPAPLDLALRLVSDGGTVIVQNAYHPGVRLPVPLRDLFRRSIRLIGSFSYCRRQHDDFALALGLLRSHTDQVAYLVSDAGEFSNLPAVLDGGGMHSVRQVLTIRA
ncbi:zinc-dependent alcohol dehydrogenase [Amycolatopsis rhizosphaerae]|nr:FAD-dependent oxidoreductase [Amycolatopsis rhizosphaerae]